MLFAVLPQWIQELGEEIGNAWPIFILVAAVLGAARRGTVLLEKKIENSVKPVIEDLRDQGAVAYREINLRLARIDSQIFPNGGGSLSDKLDLIKAEIEASVVFKNDISANVKVIMDSNSTPMFRSNKEGIIVQCNQAYLDFWGFTEQAQASTDEWQYKVKNPDLAFDRQASVVETPQDWSFIVEMINGQMVRIAANVLYDVDGNYDGYIGYISKIGYLPDATEEKDERHYVQRDPKDG